MKKSMKFVSLLIVVVMVLAALVACTPSKPAPHKHEYATTWSSDENAHWHAATCEHSDLYKDWASHEWNAGVVTTPAAEGVEGVMTYTCTVCGKTMTEAIPALAPHVHTFANAYTKDATGHWHAATCEHTSERKDFAEHTYGEWIVSVPATLEAEGTEVRTCSVCGYEETRSIPQLEEEDPGDDIPYTIYVVNGDVTRFEAEDAYFTEAEGAENPITIEEKDGISGGKGVGYFQDAGKALTFKFKSSVAGKVVVSFAMGSGSWPSSGDGCGIAVSMTAEEVNAALTFTVNGKAVAVAGDDLPSGTEQWFAYNIGIMTAEMDVVKGTNKIVITSTGVAPVNFDYIEVGMNIDGGSVTPGHVHTYADTYSKDETGHWYAATCEHTTLKKDFAAHTFGAWQTVTPATKEAEGSEKRACSVCGYEETRSIPKITDGDGIPNTNYTVTGNVTRFEAEDAYFTEAEGAENPITIEEKAGQISGDKGVGYFQDAGKALTFKFESKAAGAVVVSFAMGSGSFDFSGDPSGCAVSMTADEVNASLTFEVNGKAFTVAGDDLPSGTESFFAYNIGIMTATIDVVKGVNKIVITSTGVAPVNFDYIELAMNIESSSYTPGHVHTYATTYSKDATGHWFAATCEHKSEKGSFAAHTYGAWQTVKAATKEAEGSEKRVCSVCGYEETRVIPKIGDITEVDAGALSPVSAKIGIGGYEWGPSADMILFEVDGKISAADLSADMFTVTVDRGNYTVDAAYPCDEKGVKVDSDSKYFAVHFKVKAGNLSPFTYANSLNNWTKNKNYSATVSLASGKIIKVVESSRIAKYSSLDFSSKSLPLTDRVVPCTASWTKGTFSEGGNTLQWAAYETDAMKKDSGKNALVIWLHGAGEGGTDVDIALLGNDVTNLGEETVQAHFVKNGLQGAYVLAVQTPTMWMNSGNGSYTNNGASMYAEILMNTIKNYAEKLNSDVDLNRVYVGGCSNGGFMTVKMMLTYGDYFAAGYPVCEAYSDSWITDAQIADLATRNLWFTHSADDRTVNPSSATYATYIRLLKAGAKSVYFSCFESVKGTDDPTASQAWGQGSGNYMGHYSWIYTLQDKCLRTQSTLLTAASEIKPSNALGGGEFEVKVDGKVETLWGWMAAQVKGEHHGSTGEGGEEPSIVPYVATFDVPNGVTIYAYPGHDYDGEGTLCTKMNAVQDTEPYQALKDGSDQINFKVVLPAGYVIKAVSATEGTYKNIKGPDETGVANAYRITKITGDLTVKVEIEASAPSVEYTKYAVLEGNTRFEAEDAKFGDVEGAKNPITVEEKAGKGLSGDKGVGYFQDEGKTLTFTFASKSAGKVVLSVAAGSGKFQSNKAVAMDMDTVNGALVLTMNGKAFTLSGEGLPSGTENWFAYNIGILTAEIDVVAGDNVIVITSTGTAPVNFDYIELDKDIDAAAQEHVHTFADTYSKDETGHWYAATCEHTTEKKDFAAHTFGEWTTVTPATTEAEGSEKRTCSACGYEETRPIDKLPAPSVEYTKHTVLEGKTRFEAEDAKFGDVEGAANPITVEEKAGKGLSGDKGVGYFQDAGKSLTFTFASKSAGKVVLSVAAGSGKFQRNKAVAMDMDTLNGALVLTMNGKAFTLSGEGLPAGTENWFAYNIGIVTAEIDVVAGDNVIVITSTATAPVNFDYIELNIDIDAAAQEHVHTFADTYSKDETGHWYAATCEHTTEKKDFAAHTFGEWATVTPATTEAEGSEKRACSVCGYEESRSIPVLVVYTKSTAVEGGILMEAEDAGVVGTPTYNNPGFVETNAADHGEGHVGNWGNGDNVMTFKFLSDAAYSNAKITVHAAPCASGSLPGPGGSIDSSAFLMYINSNDWHDSVTYQEAYSLSFDGEHWYNYQDFVATGIALVKGENQIKIEANGGVPLNFDYIIVEFDPKPEEPEVSYTKYTVLEGNTRFEAEDAKFGDVEGAENPITAEEKADKGLSGDKGVGYFQDAGKTLTFTFASKSAGKATVSFAMGSGSWPSSGNNSFRAVSMTADEVNTALTFTVNGKAVTVAGDDLPSGTEMWFGYNIGIMTAEMDVVAGDNVIVVTSTGVAPVNFDYIELNIDIDAEPEIPEPEVPYTKYAVLEGKTRFEAEDATFGDVEGAENPITTEEKAGKGLSGDVGVGYFQDAGKSLTFSFKCESACKVTVSFAMGSGSWPSSGNNSFRAVSMTSDEVNAALTFAINGQEFTVAGDDLPSGTEMWFGYNIGIMTAEVDLVRGNNLIVITSTGLAPVNFDYIEINIELPEMAE